MLKRIRLDWRAALSGLVILVLLSSGLLLVAACTPNSSAVLPLGLVTESPPDPAGPAEPPRVNMISMFDHPTTNVTPHWTLSFDRSVSAAMSGDGRYVLIGRSYGSVRTPTQWGALVYDGATGEQLWRKTYATGYRTIEVGVLGMGPQFAVSLFAYNSSGTLLVYDPAGKTAWSRQVSSSVCLAASPAGTRVFGVDRGRSQVFVVDALAGRDLAQITTTMDATVQVSPTGQALIITGTSLVLLSTEGRVLARVPAAQAFQDVQFAPTGDGILATTGGGDSSVYRFDARGGAVWEQRLAGGGSNSLALSSDGRHILAYNVGVDNGIVLLDAIDGSILHRNEFTAVEGAKSSFVRWVKLLPDAAGYLVNYAVARDLAGVHSQAHNLLLFDLEGQLLARLDLGANVDVLISDDGATCVSVNTVPGEFNGTNKVKYYDIRPLFGSH